MVAAQLKRLGLFARALQKFLLSPQLFNLSFREALCVRRAALERQRIIRILRVLLVEHIVSAIVPVYKALGVAARLLDGLGGFAYDWWLWNCCRALLSLVRIFIGSREVHFMGIYYLRLLLHVESILVVLDLRLLVLVAVVLFVVREYVLGIGIADESVGASLEPTLVLITGG